MSIVKLMTATTLAAALMVVMTSSALAQSMSQEQELNVNNSVKVNCTTGAYGQSSTCTAEASGNASGKQSQRMDNVVCRRDGNCVYPHTTANTGADFGTMAAAATSLISGSVAAVIKLKKRVA